jgi:plastocyanin
MDTGGQYDHTFTEPGTYEYYCSVHPHMKAKVIVQ